MTEAFKRGKLGGLCGRNTHCTGIATHISKRFAKGVCAPHAAELNALNPGDSDMPNPLGSHARVSMHGRLLLAFETLHEGTSEDYWKIIGGRRATVSRALNELAADGVFCHIDRYVPPSITGNLWAVYTFGPGINAIRPVADREVTKKRLNDERKLKNPDYWKPSYANRRKKNPFHWVRAYYARHAAAQRLKYALHNVEFVEQRWIHEASGLVVPRIVPVARAKPQPEFSCDEETLAFYAAKSVKLSPSEVTYDDGMIHVVFKGKATYDADRLKQFRAALKARLHKNVTKLCETTQLYAVSPKEVVFTATVS